MKKYLTFAAGLLTCASLMLATVPAFARADVSVGVNIGIPGMYPAPVYVEPRPVYVQPQPVYVQPPRAIYVQPRPIYVESGPTYYRGRQWEERRWKERHHRHDHNDRYGRGERD